MMSLGNLLRVKIRAQLNLGIQKLMIIILELTVNLKYLVHYGIHLCY